MEEIMILGFILLIPILAAFFTSRAVHIRLEKSGNKNSRLLTFISFIFSFAIVLGIIVLIFLNTFRIER